MRTMKFTFNKNVVPVSHWCSCLLLGGISMGHLQIFSILRFFIRVFSSTPKNKRVFSNRCLFRRKYVKYEWFVQIIECQRFLFDVPFSVMQ